MKRTVKVKNLIAFTAVLILLLSITAIPAYADFPPLTTAGRRMGAFLLSAIQAINITLTSTAAQSTGAEIYNYLADPLDVQYSYQEMWTDQPKIQIWEDYVTIDGQEYTDVWLSNEAATKFQVNAYDFKSAYNIASNSNGTFASGYGEIDGLPAFAVDNTIKTQAISIPYRPDASATYDLSDSFDVRTSSGTYPDVYQIFNGLSRNMGQTSASDYPLSAYLQRYNQTSATLYVEKQNGTRFNGNQYVNIISEPFDFDYVSGTIPAQEILDPDEGLMLRIPSNSIPDMHQFVVDNPEFTQPGGAPIDVNIDPDVMTKLDDLIDIIAPIIPIIRNGDIVFTYNHTEPYTPVPDPAPDVDPDTPIDQITYEDYYQTITNQTTFINEGIQNIDQGITNIQNQNDQIIENQDTIINDSIPEIIENIPKIDEICNNIDTAPYHDLDTGLDHLPTVFLPFITDLRSALGIWHYVTEWIGQISTSFAFVTGCLVGTSIMTPIYAAIAGFMCVKVYRRMTG